MKTILIKQSCGLGDILFCQKIGSLLVAKGHRVIWPVYKEYSSLLTYLNGFSIEFVDESHDFDYKEEYNNSPKGRITEFSNCIVITTDGCVLNDNWLIAKYDLVGLDWKDWSNYVSFNRDLNKEKSLFYEKLDLKDAEEYALINNFIGTPPAFVEKINITPSDINIRKVFLEILPDFTLFDWCTVVENASELHIEGSALMYICEKLSLKSENKNKMFLYSRDDFHHVGCVYSKPWQQVRKNIRS